MIAQDRINILVVDDQPAKLVSYEAVLAELGENLIKAGSAREALELLLKHDIAVILVDVCMPELDGFQLAHMIRDHPRFQRTAIVFISAVQLDDFDRVRGYQLGAVDYVPVPIIPELLRAKVKVFAELYRKTKQLEDLNRELEHRVAERTAELESVNKRLQLAIDIAQLGTWDWDLRSGGITWSPRHYEIFGYRPGEVSPTVQAWCERLHPDDRSAAEDTFMNALDCGASYHQVYRSMQPDGSVRWLEARGQQEVDAVGLPRRMMGVVMDITEHKLAEEQQRLMVRELHHRVKNLLANVQAIASMTARSASTLDRFQNDFSARLQSLARTHTLFVTNAWQKISMQELIASELGNFAVGSEQRYSASGPAIDLPSESALLLGLALHELATNAVKYGALSTPTGRIEVAWGLLPEDDNAGTLDLHWIERGGPEVKPPQRGGFGTILLESVFGSPSGAKPKLTYDRGGLQFRAKLPYSVRQNELFAASSDIAATSRPVPSRTAIED